MTRIIIIACGILLSTIVLITWLALRAGPEPAKRYTEADAVRTAKERPRLQQRSAPLSRQNSTGDAEQIEHLRAELRSLRAELDARTDTADDREPATSTQLPGPVPPSDPAKLIDAELAWNDDYAEQLDDRLAEEPRDAAWANDTQAVAVAALSEIIESNVRMPECGATLCRLQIDHRDTVGHDRVLARMRDAFPWDGAAIVMPSNHDGPTTIIYLARPGTILPPPRSTMHNFRVAE